MTTLSRLYALMVMGGMSRTTFNSLSMNSGGPIFNSKRGKHKGYLRNKSTFNKNK